MSCTLIRKMKELPSIDILNKEFSGLSPEKRIERLYDYFTEDEVLMSSSFGTTSIYLLHLIHRMHPTQTIYTIDTGFLFDKTHDYMDTISRKYNLNIQKIKPFPPPPKPSFLFSHKPSALPPNNPLRHSSP